MRQGAQPRRGRRRGAHPRRAGAAAARRDFGRAPARRRPTTRARQVFRKRLREGELDDKEIEIELAEPRAAAGDHGPGRHGGDDRAAARHVRQLGGAQAQDAQAQDRRGA